VSVKEKLNYLREHIDTMEIKGKNELIKHKLKELIKTIEQDPQVKIEKEKEIEESGLASEE